MTGADHRRIGKFERCRGGTLLLDEIGDMPLRSLVRRQIATGKTDVYADTHRRVDRALLAAVLDHTRGNQRDASRVLGISRQTLRTRLRTLGMHVVHGTTEEDDGAS